MERNYIYSKADITFSTSLLRILILPFAIIEIVNFTQLKLCLATVGW